MNYRDLNMDDLVERLREAAEDDLPGDGQLAAVERINAIKREINSRDGAMERYRTLLGDPSARVRYTAALAVQREDPNTAYRMFKILVDEPKSLVKLKARMAMYQLEDSGRLKT